MALPIEDRILSALRGQKIDTIKPTKPRLIKIYIASHKIGEYSSGCFLFVCRCGRVGGELNFKASQNTRVTEVIPVNSR